MVCVGVVGGCVRLCQCAEVLRSVLLDCCALCISVAQLLISVQGAFVHAAQAQDRLATLFKAVWRAPMSFINCHVQAICAGYVV
jgi:hypothetical protein